MVTATSVTTTGINWESVLTIILGIVSLVSIVIGAFLRQQSKAIANAITNQTSMLESKLETKENVNTLRTQLANLRAEFDASQRRRGIF